MTNPNPTAAVLVIGDEILSGQTHDTNMRTIATALGPLGIELKEARVVADDPDAIIAAVKALSARWTYVFTTGGIGPTHDDITADAVAAAFGASIGVRDDARRVLETWYARKGVALTPARLRMARIPDGAVLIDNPVSGAPGFRIENVHVMAGVPKIMAAMLDTILPTLARGRELHKVIVRAEGLQEGDIAQPLAALAGRMPDVSFGSYPGPVDADPRYVRLVARGLDAERVAVAGEALADLARDLDCRVSFDALS